jgi:thiol-disulfide isomerase/thioredoxin
MINVFVATLMTCIFISTAVAADTPAKFVLQEPPKALTDVQFNDSAGNTLSLSGFRGKVVLLNVWATWCAPCRQEMPALDRLLQSLGGKNFEVIALSVDRAGFTAVAKFYDHLGIKRLAQFNDRSGEVTRRLGITGLPATLLIDREGREIGRLVGPAEWDSPEMVTFIKSRL